MKCVYGWAGVLYIITKFSWIDSLPNFVTHGPPLRASLLLKDPNELGCDNKHDTNGWVNLSVIDSVESFLLYPDEPFM